MKMFSKLFNNRKFKYGGYAMIMMVVAIVLVVLLNLLMSVLDSKYSLKVDMTANKLFSLTTQTKEFLSSLDEDIYVYTLSTADTEDAQVIQILEKFAALNNKIHISNLDIKNNPTVVNYYTTTQGENVSYDSIIISSAADPNDENQRYRVLDSYDMYSYSSETESYSVFSAESAITRGIAYIINDNLPRVWFLADHNETDYNTEMKSVLESENYEVGYISLATNPEDLESGDILICILPEVDLSPDEREVLKGFAETGGKIILGFDPRYEELPNFQSILSLYGLKIRDGLVIESEQGNYTSNGPFAIVPQLSSHEITSSISLPVLFYISGAIEVPDVISDYNVTIDTLVSSSDTSFIETDLEQMDYVKDTDAPSGPFPLAVAVEKTDSEHPENNVQMIVVSSAISLQAIEDMSTFGNSDLFMNMVGWMSPQEDEIYIRSKSMQSAVLYIQTKAQILTLTILVCIVVPFIVFGAAIFVFLKRRHL